MLDVHAPHSKERLHRKIAVHIASQADGLTTRRNDLRRCFVGTLQIDVSDRNSCAAARELERNGTTDSFRGSVDQGHLLRKGRLTRQRILDSA
jgi:hypothetical protein